MSTKAVTPAQIIFNKRFICQIQQMHTLSESKLNIFGISTSGNKDIDETLLRQWIHMPMTIAEMVEYNNKGIPIIVNNPVECVEIYETVKAHLKMWHDHVTNNINVGNVPVDDLRKMDDFASKVFPIAAGYKKPEELRISKGIQEMLNLGPKAFKINRRIVDDTPISKPPQDQPKHTPLANIIAREFSSKTQGR